MIQKYYLFPKWPAPASVKVCTTLRSFHESKEFSTNGFFSDDMAVPCNDNSAFIDNSWRLLKQDLGLTQMPAWLNQTHTASIISAHKALAEPLHEADASWTNQLNILCVIRTADCLPLVFCDKKGLKIATVHAGWQGLAKGIVENTVQALNENPEDLLVWLGPAISQKHFEVGQEVREIFIKTQPEALSAFIPSKKDHWMADLYQLAKLRLQKSGVTDIYSENHCTFEEEELFYSYRRNKTTQRMLTLAWLAP